MSVGLHGGDDRGVVGLRRVVRPAGLHLLLGDGTGFELRLADVAEDDLVEAVVGAGLGAGRRDVQIGVGGNSVALPSSAARGCAASQVSTPSDCGPKIAYMSAKFRHSTSLAGLVSTEMPSKATLSSMNSMPASSHSGHLFLVDRAGGVGDVGLAGAERLEAVTGAGTVDGGGDAGAVEQLLADGGGDGLDGGRAGDHDIAFDVGGAVSAVAGTSSSVVSSEEVIVVVTARRGDEAEGEQQSQPGEPLLLEQGMPSLGEQQVSYR